MHYQSNAFTACSGTKAIMHLQLRNGRGIVNEAAVLQVQRCLSNAYDVAREQGSSGRPGIGKICKIRLKLGNPGADSRHSQTFCLHFSKQTNAAQGPAAAQEAQAGNAGWWSSGFFVASTSPTHPSTMVRPE
eukprot:1155326-Pelagomonas_calceolata.AAC.2